MWYWVTRYPHDFHKLMGDQRTLKFWGVIAWYQSLCSDPRARPDPVGESEPKPRGRPFKIFFYMLLSFLFQKCRDPNPWLDLKGGSKQEPGLLRCFHFILSKHFFMSFRFKVFNYAEAFSNGRPINIYISQNEITMKAFYAFFLNDIQNKTLIQSSTILFTKYPMFKRK